MNHLEFLKLYIFCLIITCNLQSLQKNDIKNNKYIITNEQKSIKRYLFINVKFDFNKKAKEKFIREMVIYFNPFRLDF